MYVGSNINDLDIWILNHFVRGLSKDMFDPFFSSKFFNSSSFWIGCCVHFTFASLQCTRHFMRNPSCTNNTPIMLFFIIIILFFISTALFLVSVIMLVTIPSKYELLTTPFCFRRKLFSFYIMPRSLRININQNITQW